MSKSSEREHPHFTVPHSSLMLEMSQDIHLQLSKDIFLQGSFPENYSISRAANSIVDLFNLFKSRIVMFGQRAVPWQDESVSKVSVRTVCIRSDYDYLFFTFRA